MKRVDIKAILANPVLRRRLMALTIKATCDRESDTDMTMERAYELADMSTKKVVDINSKRKK